MCTPFVPAPFLPGCKDNAGAELNRLDTRGRMSNEYSDDQGYDYLYVFILEASLDTRISVKREIAVEMPSLSPTVQM